MRTDDLHLEELPNVLPTTRPSRLADLLPRPNLRTTARPAPTPADTIHPDQGPDPVEVCHGYWSGPDAAHTQHEPCLNPAIWAGLSEHKHAVTTLRCNAHRQLIEVSISQNMMFCLTCHRNIRVMNWREL